VTTTTETSWAEHALAALRRGGYRRGGARTAVIAALADQDCAVTAFELEDELRRRKAGVGRASIYRALEQLEQLGLLQRLEVCRGTAGYERVEPDGEHHHHAICRECGRLIPFEDASLERAIDKVVGGMSFDADEHEVVIRGLCERCSRIARRGNG
jgi:Fur family transcriptional regulator, ferric uptake regulator